MLPLLPFVVKPVVQIVAKPVVQKVLITLVARTSFNNKPATTVSNLLQSINNIQEATPLNRVIDRVIKKNPTFSMGDHIYTYCTGFTHHGIYIGYDKVIHYGTPSGRDKKLSNAEICIVSLEEFSDGKDVYPKSEFESPVKYSRIDVYLRAHSKTGENKYNLAFNNCENFARWCRNGN